MIRVVLPHHLRSLAKVKEAELEVKGAVTLRSVLDALEVRYPALRGTVRDHTTKKRRPMVRFFACEDDFSNADLETLLPDAVAKGEEPLMIVGALAGG